MMTRLALAFAIAAGPAWADDARHVWPTQSAAHENSTLTLGEPQKRGAVATLVFVNTPVHRDTAAETITLEWQGLPVTVHYQRRTGNKPDRITVTPPAGYVAVPRVLDVEEKSHWQPGVLPGIVHIYSVEAIG
jgi:hypothetical protein